MAVVESVRGPVDLGRLGQTLMHEHVFVLSTEHVQNYGSDWWDEEARVADAIAKLNALYAKGIHTIVDPTVWGLGRYIPRIQRIAAQTPVNIIVATGLYVYEELPQQYAYRGPGLLVRGPNVVSGYWNKPEATGQAFAGGRAASCSSGGCGKTSTGPARYGADRQTGGQQPTPRRRTADPHHAPHPVSRETEPAAVTPGGGHHPQLTPRVSQQQPRRCSRWPALRWLVRGGG
jgi:acyl-CoA synthetase (AMP-forming)/AMP-acid ligase II